MRSLERDAQADNFIGHQYTWIGWDELPTWATATPYLKLFACLRSAVDVPVKRVRSTGNPGGVGHVWCKVRFVGLHNAYAWTPRYDEESQLVRVFIPSRVQDNQILVKNDPGYVARLRALAGVSQALVQAWLEGDWDVIAGAYFDCFGPHCIIPASEIRPDSWWPFWLGGDWGFKHSTAIYWFTTDDRGRTIVTNEMVTSGKSAEELAEMIAGQSQLQGNRKIDDFWFSPDAFAQRTDAETVGDQLGNALIPYGLPYPARGSNDKIGSAQLMYKLFKHRVGGKPDGEPDPQLLISDACPELLNVLPAIIHDPDKQEQTLKMDGDDPFDGCKIGVYGKLGPRRMPIADQLAAKINSPDPTVRHIQALMVQRQLAQQAKLQGVPYNRRH
jgi:hypothetical protein